MLNLYIGILTFNMDKLSLIYCIKKLRKWKFWLLYCSWRIFFAGDAHVTVLNPGLRVAVLFRGCRIPIWLCRNYFVLVHKPLTSLGPWIASSPASRSQVTSSVREFHWRLTGTRLKRTPYPHRKSQNSEALGQEEHLPPGHSYAEPEETRLPIIKTG